MYKIINIETIKIKVCAEFGHARALKSMMKIVPEDSLHRDTMEYFLELAERIDKEIDSENWTRKEFEARYY